MSLFIFLTVVQAIVAAALVGVVLMQRSEGGGLGIGGSPSGAFGARGAADFLTRATKWLAIAFVILGVIGMRWPEGRPVPKLFALPGYILASNVAGLLAWRACRRTSGVEVSPRGHARGDVDPAHACR